MSPNFKKAFCELIGIEGGYVNDPTDRGGETKYGISKKSYPNVDIKNLTLAQAQEIYYRDFWKHPRMNLDLIPDYAIALELFDTGVNTGSGTARRMLQESLNLMNRNGKNFPDLVVDGIIGGKTFDAYQQVDKKILLKVLNGLQFMRYTEICLADPAQERFFNGWMQRV